MMSALENIKEWGQTYKRSLKAALLYWRRHLHLMCFDVVVE